MPPLSEPVAPPLAADLARCARWYEDTLGWATAGVPGEPVLLRTGLRFDVLELPAGAGHAVLRRIGPTGPVLRLGRRMLFLVAAGSADEVPALLEWLEWGAVALDLRAIGKGGLIAAPAPPGTAPSAGGAAVWLRPPAPGHETEPTLPVFAGIGNTGTANTGTSITRPGNTGPGNSAAGNTGIGDCAEAPDLVRLVAAAATECHRARLAGLINANRVRHHVNTGLPKDRQTQPLAFS